MTTITEISRLSWRAIEQDYSIDRFEQELEDIASRPRNYQQYLVAIGAGFACGGFCKLFGCDWIAFLYASICAFLGFRARAKCFEFGINHYMSIAIAVFIATSLAYLTSLTGLSTTPYHPLLACALFVVPGVPLINFVDDMIDNYLLVGMTRAANCMMIICSMTFGITMALGLLGLKDVSIDQKFSELSMIPYDGYIAYAIAAAIAAMGFSMIFNVPRRVLWAIALGGVISVCTRNFVNFDLHCGPVIGSFMGSMMVSLIGIKAVHWFHVPNHILTIPSVIPMIPGVLLYRFFLGLIGVSKGSIDIISTLTNGVNAVLIILVISIGVAIPNIFARRYIARDRRLRLERMLEQRRERGIFLEW